MSLTGKPACVPMFSLIGAISILTSNHHLRPFSTVWPAQSQNNSLKQQLDN